MIVAVGGQSRKAGKTSAVCDIIAAFPQARWTAVKITPHAHTAPAAGEGDTGRYLAAGAVHALLITGEPPIELPEAENLIVESNAIFAQLQPDVGIFVEDPDTPEWKPSAGAVAAAAAYRIRGRITPEVLEAIGAWLSESRP